HLKKIRKELGVSQEELGYRTGLELSQIGRIERGVINTSISNVFLIADALQIEPKELFDFNYKES
ncbi:MAG TPA: helix-turn-helix transcriptional regulator, partial [Chitinophagales bacterium]|nr:helix-turn-helix transcriptional regulator [Chitinophagales bacterium]